MRFIRKGGRVIPIRDGADTSAQKNARGAVNGGTAVAVSGAIAAVRGANKAAQGRMLVQTHFAKALTAAKYLGHGSPEYKVNKALARKGMKAVISGHRLMAVGALGYAAGAGAAVAGIMQLKRRNKNGQSK